ncbi:MAG: hypothetical protein LBG06_10960 [Deltaproteobacteria bacterium]|nr:hypothetical protein [Deltaproteobacteria bacterium]
MDRIEQSSHDRGELEVESRLFGLCVFTTTVPAAVLDDADAGRLFLRHLDLKGKAAGFRGKAKGHAAGSGGRVG